MHRYRLSLYQGTRCFRGLKDGVTDAIQIHEKEREKRSHLSLASSSRISNDMSRNAGKQCEDRQKRSTCVYLPCSEYGGEGGAYTKFRTQHATQRPKQRKQKMKTLAVQD